LQFVNVHIVKISTILLTNLIKKVPNYTLGGGLPLNLCQNKSYNLEINGGRRGRQPWGRASQRAWRAGEHVVRREMR
jgi:hypothetical protein